MTKEDLINHIVAEMHSHESNGGSSGSPDDVLCQNCGLQITHERVSRGGDLDDYVIHRVPTHGGQEISSVFYCGPNCLKESMDRLFDLND